MRKPRSSADGIHPSESHVDCWTSQTTPHAWRRAQETSSSELEAVILITHDRHMLDRVCTDLIGLHGNGEWGNYASVAQWLEADKRAVADSGDAGPAAQPVEEAISESTPEAPKPQPVKLSYHEKKELAAMEEIILEAEGALELLQTALDEANAAADHVKLVELHAEQQEAQDRVAELYARWEELEGKAA